MKSDIDVNKGVCCHLEVFYGVYQIALQKLKTRECFIVVFKKTLTVLLPISFTIQHSFPIPNHSPKSRSVLQDGSRSLVCFGNEIPILLEWDISTL